MDSLRTTTIFNSQLDLFLPQFRFPDHPNGLRFTGIPFKVNGLRGQDSHGLRLINMLHLERKEYRASELCPVEMG